MSTRVGTYTAIGFRWMRVGGSPMAHLVPKHPGTLSRTLCGYHSAYDTTLESPEGLLTAIERCGRCEVKDGTAGPKRDGRVEGMGE